jgi:hypothetical protein
MATTKVTRLALLALAALAAGCMADVRHGHGWSLAHQQNAAWEIVRRDPCRYDEYQRFAQDHSNPNKRDRFVERLAREGCSFDRKDRSDRLDRHNPRG